MQNRRYQKVETFKLYVFEANSLEQKHYLFTLFIDGLLTSRHFMYGIVFLGAELF
jgi:hypothetical protein